VAIGVAVIGLIVVATSQAVGADNMKVPIYLDRDLLECDPPATLVEGTTMVPVRFVAEALGFSVTWHGPIQVVWIEKGDRVVLLRVGKDQAVIDGETRPLPVAPVLIEDRTFVPLRFVAEALDLEVIWNDQDSSVSLYSHYEGELLGFYAIKSSGELFSKAAADEIRIASPEDLAQVSSLPDLNTVAFGWSTLTAEGLSFDAATFRWPEPFERGSYQRGEVTVTFDYDMQVEDIVNMPQRSLLMVFQDNQGGELQRLLGLTPADLKSLASGAVSDAISKGFDGILLDLEGNGLAGDVEGDRERMTHLYQAFAFEAHQEGIELYACLHAPNSSYKGYDFQAIGQVADRVVIMAYDYAKEASFDPEPLVKVEEAIALTLAKVPASKVLLGLNGFYETEETLAEKLPLARKHRLAGLAYWRLGAENLVVVLEALR